jgi:small subunit ribosomal protein S21
MKYLYNMLIVKINNGDLNKALKTLKSKVIKTKQNQMLFDKREFVKKSVVKRQQKLKATYVQKVRTSLD